VHKEKEPCIKRKGPKTEERENPEWGIIVPDDCRVDAEHRLAYEYGFSDEYRDRSSIFFVQLWRTFRGGFGGFIPCASLRHAILATVYGSFHDTNKADVQFEKACAVLPRTIGCADVMTLFTLWLVSWDMRFQDDFHMFQSQMFIDLVFSTLRSLYLSENDLDETNIFSQLLPLFVEFSPLPSIDCILEVPTPSIDSLARAVNTVFGYRLDNDISSFHFTAYDYAFHIQLRRLVLTLPYSYSKGPFTAPPSLAALEAVFVHPRFHRFIELSDRIVSDSTLLSLNAAYRFFQFLVAEFIFRLARLEVAEAFVSVETVAAAWKLVRFTLSQQHVLQSHASDGLLAMMKSYVFLGSCVLPPGEARDASIVLNVVEGADFPSYSYCADSRILAIQSNDRR
jgi:hypothetical protein